MGQRTYGYVGLCVVGLCEHLVAGLVCLRYQLADEVELGTGGNYAVNAGERVARIVGKL